MSFELGPEAWSAVWLSLKVAFWATAVCLPLALWIGYVLARKSFWGKSLLNTIVHLPLVMPPVVTGYLLLLTLGNQGFVGQFLAQFGIEVAFRWTGAVIAAALMAFPLVVRAVRLGYEAVDTKLEQAATTLGASSFGVFRTITLPLIFPALIAGGVLGFAKALGEFGATITFVAAIPGETLTVPSAIYGLLQTPGGERQVLTLTLISVAISAVALILSEWFAGRLRKRAS